MKLNNYIKTKDISIIRNFIKVCKECNIPVDEEYIEDELEESEIYGIGIFTKEPTINNNILDFDISVWVITEEPASWWNKLSLCGYESFIKQFDKNQIKTFLNKKFEQTKKDFPQFTVGCEMVSTIDLEYGFYKNNWEPYILKSYCYSPVSDEWQPRTQKGYGNFKGFRIWTKDILNMDKKQVKKLWKKTWKNLIHL